MSYPFVAAQYAFGPRKGPVRAFVIHMAEGGGTVGYLSRPNPNGVSVHYVIERTGRIVQMVQENQASGSLRPTAIRTTDDADGFYGATAARAVLGAWHRDPNSAVISLEIEGFAKAGPEPRQVVALRDLVADVRSRYPGMGLLGHRDFADYKACPGKLIPWHALGGHGPAQKPQEADMPGLTLTDAVAAPGTVKVKQIAGVKAVQVADREYVGMPAGTEKPAVALARLREPLPGGRPGEDRQTVRVLGGPGIDEAVILAAQVDFTPATTTDCTDYINVGYDAGLDEAGRLIAAAPRKGGTS